MLTNYYKRKPFLLTKQKTKKTIFLTMIATYGGANNICYKNLVQSEVTMDALFE